MSKIDVGRIIKKAGLDKKDVADQLFPDNKFSHLALRRVIIGNGLLNSEQISKLASLSGMTVSELFGPTEWRNFAQEGKIIFENNDYRAELDTVAWTTKIFHKGSMFHEEIIHSKMVPLTDYLQNLDTVIAKKQFTNN